MITLTRVLGLAAALSIAVLPGTVTAARDNGNPVTFKGKRIVEGVSIGGLKVGMSKAQAIALWGKPDRVCRRGNVYDPDDRRRACSYSWVRTKNGKEAVNHPYAGFTHSPSGEVTSVYISLTKYNNIASLERSYKLAAPKVLPFNTSKNIGLRSTLEDARRAYGIPPPAVPIEDEPSYWESVVVRQPQGCTWFSSSGDSKPVYTYIDSIAVTSPEWCPKDPAVPAAEDS